MEREAQIVRKARCKAEREKKCRGMLSIIRKYKMFADSKAALDDAENAEW